MKKSDEYEEEFEWNGRLCTVKELADIAGINERTMSRRLDRYKTMEAVKEGVTLGEFFGVKQ